MAREPDAAILAFSKGTCRSANCIAVICPWVSGRPSGTRTRRTPPVAQGQPAPQRPTSYGDCQSRWWSGPCASRPPDADGHAPENCKRRTDRWQISDFIHHEGSECLAFVRCTLLIFNTYSWTQVGGPDGPPESHAVRMWMPISGLPSPPRPVPRRNRPPGRCHGDTDVAMKSRSILLTSRDWPRRARPDHGENASPFGVGGEQRISGECHGILTSRPLAGGAVDLEQ